MAHVHLKVAPRACQVRHDAFARGTEHVEARLQGDNGKAIANHRVIPPRQLCVVAATSPATEVKTVVVNRVKESLE